MSNVSAALERKGEARHVNKASREHNSLAVPFCKGENCMVLHRLQKLAREHYYLAQEVTRLSKILSELER